MVKFACMKNLGKLLVRFLSLICFILALVFCYRIFSMGIIPLRLAVPLLCAVMLLTLIIILCANFVSRRLFSRFISALLVIALIVVYTAGSYYTYKTSTMIEHVTTLSNTTTHHASVITLKENNYKLEDLQGKTIGITPSLDKKATNKSLADIKQTIRFETKEYDDYLSEASDLYNGTIDAMIINESSRGLIYDSDDETFANFNSYTEVIHQTTWKEKKKSVTNEANSVNVTSEPFTVLISGADSYGGLDDNGRSDSNMLLTVNPKTHRILMTSIPRDYYEPMVCSPNAKEGCPDGERDKLTHTGIYGIETTEKTIEKFMGVEINYYVKVNFSSLVNIVDAIGGVDVMVGEGLAVESFGSDAALGGVTEGENHLNGERALAFARERHAYKDGDEQRVKNQQIVLKAIFAKITSPKMATQYDDFIDALGEAFETNMSNDDLSKLIQYQLTLNPDWTFESYALTGDSDTQFCPTLGNEASVILEDSGAIKTARKKIKAVMNGKKASSVKDMKKKTDEPADETSENEESFESGTVEESPDVAGDSSTYSYSDDTTTYMPDTSQDAINYDPGYAAQDIGGPAY